jgi:hypothetical protein
MPAPKDPAKREEWIKKQSESHTGSSNPNYGKHTSEETKQKIRDAIIKKWENPEYREFYRRVCSGQNHHQWGIPLSIETRKKISESKRGSKHPMWRGGISFEPYCPKFNNEFKERVRAFFEYRCVECGAPQRETRLHVHHVNFNKQTCCDSSIPLFVPLCPACHNKTQRNRIFWEYWFTKMIESLYGGKCYVQSQNTDDQNIAFIGTHPVRSR